MEGERLATLEQALAELQAKDANTQHKLDILISHIPQSENPIPSTQITPVTPKAHGLKLALLLEFDSDCTKGMAFLNSCKFKREFCPVYADSVAINWLEATAYFQKSRSVDEYLDEFQDLITEAGYSDLKTIVVKFRWGLDTQIQNAIATMPSGCPSNMVPMDWYTAARTIDQNQATNEGFQSSYQTPSVALTPSHPATFNTVQFQAPQRSANHQHALIPRNPVPMDIDAS